MEKGRVSTFLKKMILKVKNFFVFLWKTIKSFFHIAGPTRTIIAAILATAIIYSPAIFGIIVGRYELVALNVAFWVSGGTPAIPLAIIIGIFILILISPKDKKAELKKELKKQIDTIKRGKRKMKSKVYFTREITSESVKKMYDQLGIKLKGNVAIKLHSGEKGNQNFLKPLFFKSIIDEVKGTVVECNTAYPGERNESNKHLHLIHEHEWDKYYKFDLLDKEDNDIILEIKNGKVIKKNYVGGNLKNYDSMLVLSHFKGHPMGGFGGALKQLSIGVASSRGKAYIHSAGRTLDQNNLWNDLPEQDRFLEAMADAASSVHNYFKGNIAYINVMKNLSVDCDCCSVAEDPCMKDIGVLASLDPIAIDQACIDLVYKAKDDKGQKHFIERIESRNGIHTIETAAELGFGSREYELIDLDK